ncbi:hypothetical protein MBANPS3_012405 [Mucor bainieri]
MYNRAEAACKAFGMPMLQKNADHCLAVLDQAELDVVYVEELGDKRPIIMGKEAIIRDKITYMTYAAGKLVRGYSDPTYDSYCTQQITPSPSEIPSSPVLSCSKPTAIASSSESSSAVAPGVYEGTATKQAVIDLLSTISCLTPPNIDLYQQFDNISNKSIHDIVTRFIPGVTKIPMSTFSQWLNDLPSAATLTKRKRTNGKQVLVRSMWFLLPERQDQAAANLFNKQMYVESVKTGQCITIGYARKSHGNESKSARLRLLESMAAILVDPCHCSKIYVTPICAADSPLLERDLKRSTLTKDIRHAHGDMQGEKNSLITYNITSSHTQRQLCVL